MSIIDESAFEAWWESEAAGLSSYETARRAWAKALALVATDCELCGGTGKFKDATVADAPIESCPCVAPVATAPNEFDNPAVHKYIKGQLAVAPVATGETVQREAAERLLSEVAIHRDLDPACSGQFAKDIELLAHATLAAQAAGTPEQVLREHNYFYSEPLGELKTGHYYCLCGWEGTDRNSYWKHLESFVAAPSQSETLEQVREAIAQVVGTYLMKKGETNLAVEIVDVIRATPPPREREVGKE